MANLQLTIGDGVGQIVLGRAEALNALSRAFCDEIDAAVAAFEASPEVRVILISSALKHFCAGADIREMSAMTHDEAVAEAFVGCVKTLADARKPVVVAVNGLAAGGGCELVEMCDIVIAAESALFCHPEITLAAMPGAGGTQRLARVVGKHVAMDLLLTGRAMNAQEALAAGLVSRVVPDAELASTALALARKIAAFSSPVACRIKESVRSTQTGLAEGLLAERERFHRCFLEDDFREGLQAFMDKRAPVFGQR